jgi:hypothetical protein
MPGAGILLEAPAPQVFIHWTFSITICFFERLKINPMLMFIYDTNFTVKIALAA